MGSLSHVAEGLGSYGSQGECSPDPTQLPVRARGQEASDWEARLPALAARPIRLDGQRYDGGRLGRSNHRRLGTRVNPTGKRSARRPFYMLICHDGKELNAGLASPESNVLPPVLLHLSRPTDRLVGTPAWPSSVVGYVSQRAAGPVTTPGGRGTPGMARGSCEAAVADRRGAARCNPGSAGLGRRRVKNTSC